MNIKDKLTESTILALQGKLIESITVQDCRKLGLNKKHTNNFIQTFIDITDGYQYTDQEQAELVVYLINNYSSDYYPSQNYKSILRSLLKHNISLNNLKVIFTEFKTVKDLNKIKHLMLTDQKFSDMIHQSNINLNDINSYLKNYDDNREQLMKTTTDIKPTMIYSSRLAQQDSSDSIRKKPEYLLVKHKAEEILSELYSQGYEYVNSKMYVFIGYSSHDNYDKEPYIELLVVVEKDDTTYSFTIKCRLRSVINPNEVTTDDLQISNLQE